MRPDFVVYFVVIRCWLLSEPKALTCIVFHHHNHHYFLHQHHLGGRSRQVSELKRFYASSFLHEMGMQMLSLFTLFLSLSAWLAAAPGCGLFTGVYHRVVCSRLPRVLGRRQIRRTQGFHNQQYFAYLLHSLLFSVWLAPKRAVIYCSSRSRSWTPLA